MGHLSGPVAFAHGKGLSSLQRTWNPKTPGLVCLHGRCPRINDGWLVQNRGHKIGTRYIIYIYIYIHYKQKSEVRRATCPQIFPSDWLRPGRPGPARDEHVRPPGLPATCHHEDVEIHMVGHGTGKNPGFFTARRFYNSLYWDRQPFMVCRVRLFDPLPQ